MTYFDYLIAARACSSYQEVDELMKKVADDENISDRRYYHIRHVANESAYEADTALHNNPIFQLTFKEAN